MNAEKIVYDRNDEVAGIAVFNDNGLAEIDIYDEHRAIEGNIYLGRIIKKISLANDKYGFMVNIGDGVEAFLSSSEPAIPETNMSEGQSVVVQVVQEKRAEKGARVSRNIQLAGTNLVYCPFKNEVDASSKIENPDKVHTLKALVRENTVGQEGWILRTISVEASTPQIVEEMRNLRDTYEVIRKKARTASAPSILYTKENPLFEHIRRYKDSLKEVIVDTPKLAEDIKSVFSGNVLIKQEAFEEYGVDDAIIDALERTVKLKNGGAIHIEETRAFVAIDVDSGGHRGLGSLDELNISAAREISRQIRLRNLSGKIIIDFAGSSEYRFMKKVIETLEEELADDICHSRVLGLSRAGNIEILRQRRRPSLRDLYTIECPTCSGTGRVEP